ncbi:MAG: hypothetical protein IJ971_09545 [Bacteroidales bacterium]|nr:hypothetical protein [Bacteroidales bacterium]
MNSGLRKIITVLAVLLFAMTLPAQDIPVLPADPSVMNGVMPNGMAWYIVSNASDKGVADFALVQKTGVKTVADSLSSGVSEAARDALLSLSRLIHSSPHDFLFRHGVAPGRNGYVRISENATVFRFENVPIAENTALLDSTLVMVMDIADKSSLSDDEFLKEWYSPADQAVVISGDVDAKALAQKLTYMSLMIPSRESVPRPDYEWHGTDEAVFVTDTACRSSLVEVSMTWISQRVPRKYMNTVQPAMFENAVSTLGELAVKRLRRVLEDRAIPVADVGYGHVCSESTPYDDSFTVYVVAGREDADETLAVLTEVMSSVDASGVGKDDFLVAEARCMEAMTAEASAYHKSNAEYVDRCINSFLYNSSLASPKERLAFHRSRNLPDSMRLRLFNDIAMALLDSSANLIVRCPGDPLALKESFDSVWRNNALNGTMPASVMNMTDTMGFPGKSQKVRIKSTRKEPLSGGAVWVFSNGMKVIYKRMKSDRMYYTLALSGGYGGIKGLEYGEGAFMSDYIRSCHISGLKADVFMDMINREGVSMDVDVNLSNTMIGGHAPKEKMHLMFKSLLALANERTRDDRKFRYYKECENLSLEYAEGGFMSRMTAIDSIMCPDYRYSSYKAAGKITSGFQDRAEAFFDDLSSRMNDGVMVLVGDMDEEALKKLLIEYVGGFRTQETVLRMPVVRYQPVSGWSTYTVDGDRNCVDVAMSSRMTVTAENYIAAALAASVLERKLNAAMDGSGMYVDVSYNCRIYPEERFNLLVSMSEIAQNGLVSGVESPIEVLSRVRGVLSDLYAIEVDENELKLLKARLKNAIAMEMNDPVYWVDAIVLRYLDGKDLSTNYASKIDAVNAAKVQSVLRTLDAGCKVEYVTSKKY